MYDTGQGIRCPNNGAQFIRWSKVCINYTAAILTWCTVYTHFYQLLMYYFSFPGEMKSFADQQPLPVFEFSWLVFYFSLSLALLIGVILGLATRWEVGVGMGCAVLALQYGFFGKL